MIFDLGNRKTAVLLGVCLLWLATCVNGADVVVYGDDGTLKIGTLSPSTGKATITNAPLNKLPTGINLGKNLQIPGLVTSLALSADGSKVYAVSLFDLAVWSIEVSAGSWKVTELWSTVNLLSNIDIKALPDILLPLAVHANPQDATAALVVDPLSFGIKSISSVDKTVTSYAGGAVTLEKLIGDFATTGPLLNADGTGTAASFLIPLSITSDAVGNVYVSEIGGIRKITPSGEVSQFTGQKLDIAGIIAALGGLISDASQEGMAWDEPTLQQELTTKMTSEVFPETMAAQLADAIIHTPALAPPKTASRASSRKGDPYFGLGHKDGVKGLARFNIPLVSIDATGENLFVADIMILDEQNKIALGTTRIRKVTPNGDVTTLAGMGTAQSSGTKLVEGAGTSVVFGIVTGISVDASNTIHVMETCPKGSIIRGIDATTGAVTLVSGDYLASECGTDVVVAVQAVVGSKDPLAGLLELVLPSTPSVNGPFGTNFIRRGVAMVSGQSGCGVLLPATSEFAFDGSCVLGVGSKVKALKMKSGSMLVLTAAMVVEQAITLPAGSTLVAKAPVTISGGIVLQSDGTLEVNGSPVTANDLTMGTTSVYHIHIDQDNPPQLRLLNDASISGTLVITIANTYVFPPGASAPVLSFGSNTKGTGFLEVFIVRLRSRRRSVLQAGGGATSSCGATSCIATATGLPGADDDDEVPIVVALIVVSVLLFGGLVFAVFIVAKRRRPQQSAQQKRWVRNDDEMLLSSDSSSGASSGASSSSGLFFPMGFSTEYDSSSSSY